MDTEPWEISAGFQVLSWRFTVHSQRPESYAQARVEGRGWEQPGFAFGSRPGGGGGNKFGILQQWRGAQLEAL